MSSLQGSGRLEVPKRPNAQRYAGHKGFVTNYKEGDRLWMRRGRGKVFQSPVVVEEKVKVGTYRVREEDGQATRMVNQYNLRPRNKAVEMGRRLVEGDEQGDLPAQPRENSGVVSLRRSADRDARHRKPARFR